MAPTRPWDRDTGQCFKGEQDYIQTLHLDALDSSEEQTRLRNNETKTKNTFDLKLEHEFKIIGQGQIIQDLHVLERECELVQPSFEKNKGYMIWRNPGVIGSRETEIGDS